MDIQKLKYNRELMKHKIKLENELNLINIEIDTAVNECDHLNVIIGEDETFKYRQCLFCGVKHSLSFGKGKYTDVYAANYKDYKYSPDDYYSNKERYNELQELVLKILEDNGGRLNNEELSNRLKEEIERDKVYRK